MATPLRNEIAFGNGTALELPPSDEYRRFFCATRNELKDEWLRVGASSALERAYSTLGWLDERPEGHFLMPDSDIRVGDNNNRDAIMSAILLDMISQSACQMIADSHRLVKAPRISEVWNRSMDNVKTTQARLDPYLATSAYTPNSPLAPLLKDELVSIFVQARSVAYQGNGPLRLLDYSDSGGLAVGLINEYKLRKHLNVLGYETFPTTNIKDHSGMDLAVVQKNVQHPFFDPNFPPNFHNTKFIQVKSTSENGLNSELRHDGFNNGGALVIYVPAHNGGDYFSLAESDIENLRGIVEWLAPANRWRDEEYIHGLSRMVLRGFRERELPRAGSEYDIKESELKYDFVDISIVNAEGTTVAVADVSFGRKGKTATVELLTTPDGEIDLAELGAHQRLVDHLGRSPYKGNIIEEIVFPNFDDDLVPVRREIEPPRAKGWVKEEVLNDSGEVSSIRFVKRKPQPQLV